MQVDLILAETHLLTGAIESASACVPARGAADAYDFASRCTRVHAAIAIMDAAPEDDVNRLLDLAVAQALTLELRFELAVARLMRAEQVPDRADESAEARRELSRMGVVDVPLLAALAKARAGSRRTSSGRR
jgi:hypothetical protein